MSDELEVENREENIGEEGHPAAGSCVLLAFIDAREVAPLRATARLLKEALGEVQIVCINTPETRAATAQIAEVDRWVTYGEEAAGARGIIKALRAFRPEAVCILYRTSRPAAHLKLEMLASFVCDPPWKYIKVFSALTQPADSTQAVKLQRTPRIRLWLRIWTKLGAMALRCSIAAVMAGVTGALLHLATVLSRPGERLGAPAGGEKD